MRIRIEGPAELDYEDTPTRHEGFLGVARRITRNMTENSLVLFPLPQKIMILWKLKHRKMKN